MLVGQNPAMQKPLIVKKGKPATKKTNPAVQIISQKKMQKRIAAVNAIIMHVIALRLPPLSYRTDTV